MCFDHIYSSPSRSTSLPKQLFVLLKNKTGESSLCCPHVLGCVSLQWSMVSARDCTLEKTELVLKAGEKMNPCLLG